MKNIYGLINEWLKKQGVNDYTDLDQSERLVYDQWQAILEKRVTLEDVTGFIRSQLPQLNKEMVEAVRGGNDRKALLLAARIENYSDMLAVIETPESNRQALAAHITNLINTHE